MDFDSVITKTTLNGIGFESLLTEFGVLDVHREANV